jgi:hypothetical protein
MAGSDERRGSTRVPFPTSVTVSLPTRQALVTANALDISLDGIRVISPEPLFLGEDALLTFRITSRSGVQVEEVWGRVIHARMDDDAWVVGLKFNQVWVSGVRRCWRELLRIQIRSLERDQAPCAQ